MLGKKFKIQAARSLKLGRRGNPGIRALGPEGGEEDRTREKGTKVGGGLVDPPTLSSVNRLLFPLREPNPSFSLILFPATKWGVPVAAVSRQVALVAVGLGES